MDEDGQFVLLNQGLLERKAARAAEEERAREQQEALVRGETERQKRLAEERARMEAERKQLEEERRLVEEKRRLEAERLKLAEEKQRLALDVERRKLEEERAQMQAQAAPKVASLPKAEPVQSPGRVERTVAILPWNYQGAEHRWDSRLPNELADPRRGAGPAYPGASSGIPHRSRPLISGVEARRERCRREDLRVICNPIVSPLTPKSRTTPHPLHRPRSA